MSRTAKTAGALGALALISIGVPAGVSFAATDRHDPQPAGPPATTQEESFLGGEPMVPQALQPPAGTVLHAVLKARGVQIYRCRRGAWQPLEPAASLTGVTMSPVRKVTAVHFRGPSWISDQDGSTVQGTDPVTRPAREAGDLPPALFRAAGNRGRGLFGAVTHIQRIDARGGAAPATACGGDQPIAVPFRAVYRFFVTR
ncbi:DUF3455 domain-containing protein [Actinoplanes teichomyceticus]|uniref:Uncharacterized protein DUF3455 n=1 Tax=Actinoplanes teichomyceticus TaxID=1867 RepID=A0A561W9U8_ACTTI|nr:DUF3455 domain-containing protein [Actinoplanes teichomyceticus]TWG20647.1 uncharacterized protein DUF3455 [Actinoplanes teichomyceticus]GIF14302.1 hypothetical protein Ate01nite_43340 [Actinoplanes teichomyceticus]